MTGIVTVSDISEGGLDIGGVYRNVLILAQKMSGIASVAGTVNAPKLAEKIPIARPGAIKTGLHELETSDIQSGDFEYVNFELLKDRIYIAVSDESKFRMQNGEDPLEIQVRAAAQAMSKTRDEQCVAALLNNPKTLAATSPWSTSTNSIYTDLGLAIAELGQYRPDFIVMSPDLYGMYIGNDSIKYISAGSPPTLQGAVSTVPGLGLNIYLDDAIPADSAVVGASGFAVFEAIGPTVIERDYDIDLGAEVYKADVWRQFKAPIFTSNVGENLAAVKITGLSV